MRQKLHRICCAVLVLLCTADPVLADREMSDADKKKTVYRMYAEYKKDFPGVEDISPHRAMELLSRSRVVFVDTRKPEEMAVSMLPEAVAETEFLKNPGRYQNKIIVAYCTISYRSGIFSRELTDRRIKIINLQGGILAWTLEGGKVYTLDKREVKRVHIYGDRWDYAPAGYETVKFSLLERLF